MKLKPCPFCGGEATTSHGVDDYTLEQFFFVSCEYCGSRTRKFHRYRYGEEYERKAIEAWNRREPIDKIVEQLEEYKNLECDDPNEDIDEEVEDAEELYDLGRSQGKLEAYLNAIEIVKSGGKV